MKLAAVLIVAAIAFWLRDPVWFLFNIAMRSEPFANGVAALGVFIIGMSIGVSKLWRGKI